MKKMAAELKKLQDETREYIGQIETKVKSLGGKVNALESKADSIESRMNALERKVDSAMTDIGEVFEMTARLAIAKTYGYCYASKFEIFDLSEIVQLTTPEKPLFESPDDEIKTGSLDSRVEKLANYIDVSDVKCIFLQRFLVFFLVYCDALYFLNRKKI